MTWNRHVEERRVAALHELSILDTPAESAYDDVVALAAAICDVPIAFISFVDADRQWGKAMVGVDSIDAPREHSFCSRAIARDSALLVVPDTHEDREFATNPFVVGPPNFRFYAGATIRSSDGYALGTVCIADQAPRKLDEPKLDALRALARQTAALLELRKHSHSLAAANRSLQEAATRDSLTGMLNRRGYQERLATELRRARRSRRH